ncbi:MAG: zf-HC2 domain-containing protein [Armatimonadota bacterium]
MMQCAEVQAKLAEYSVGLLDERERKAIESHLAECTSCAYELRALERVDKLLGSVTPEEPPAHLWQNIRARIEAQPQEAQSPFWQSWFTLPRLALGGAVAAAILAGVVYFGTPRAPESEAYPQADASQLMQAHQLMSWGDPLSDKAALGAMFASRYQEVP